MTSPVTLVTGASAGLGVEFARRYAARGDRLVLVARRADRLEALAAELPNARWFALDLSQPGAVDTLMADLEGEGEHVETLINNAGFGVIGKLAHADRRRQREMVDLNCGALVELAQAVLPGMIERQSGGIMNIASTAAFQPGPGMAVYFATKAFVLSFSEALHEEARPHGVHVSALCPGPTSTEFGDVAGYKGNKGVETFKMEAAPVVDAGIKGLDANKAVVVPGAMNKATAALSSLLPSSLTRKIVARAKY
ncbi:SDR family NAD(P)-dependent oxidoreductase [Sphingomicrobium nitratireducens]|uniref:SDR family NAD(P)-dependent oxidoreductase n=1 Tax=Sphingomicrobium nitratireducens TaxID=2964666 RepID=UPI0022400440|nr:SDR family oxidoreductase [Sphingomicrobium nitratireducens]